MPCLTVTMEPDLVSHYHPEPHVCINQAVAAYVLETYGVEVSQPYVGEVRRICKREASGLPCDTRLSAVKLGYIKEALRHLGYI